jgi:hypothetical protein
LLKEERKRRRTKTKIPASSGDFLCVNILVMNEGVNNPDFEKLVSQNERAARVVLKSIFKVTNIEPNSFEDRDLNRITRAVVKEYYERESVDRERLDRLLDLNDPVEEKRIRRAFVDSRYNKFDSPFLEIAYRWITETCGIDVLRLGKLFESGELPDFIEKIRYRRGIMESKD